MRQIAFMLASFAGIALAGSSCFAQSQGLFGNQGTTTQGGGAAGQGLGQGGLGAGGLGQGGLGQGGLGQGGLGQGGAALGPQLNQVGDLSAQVGQSEFVGQGNTGGFTGNRQVGTQGQGNTNPRFVQADGGQGFQQPDNEQRTERRIRPRYRVAFDYDTLSSATVADRAQLQVANFQTAFNLPASISVELDESGTAVLRGVAASDDMRRLIAHLVRFEHGVRDVKNELVVAGETGPTLP